MDFMNSMKGKAKEFSEISKLNSSISSAEKQIVEAYEKIGYEIFRAYKDQPIPEVEGLIKQVRDLHQTIEDCKAQIKVINSANLCPQCGAKINKGMAFCSGCGYKLPVAEQAAPAAPVAPAACSKCGAPLEAGALFCTSCGNRIGS